jgi:glycosyltransferase involved in cell wall biosynthesis
VNILWISHFVPYPPHGGNLQRSFHLLRVLSRVATIDLVTFHRRVSLAETDIDAARAGLLRFCREVGIHRIPNEASRLRFAAALARNLLEGEPYTVRELRSVPFRLAIEERLRTERYDAVHFDTIDLAPYRLLVNGIPTSMNHHNVESHLFTRRAPFERNPLAGAYLRFQARKLDRFEAGWYGRFDVNLFTSRVDRDRARAQAPAFTARVVPNGVDTRELRPAPEGPGTRVVWVGGLGWFPNRDAVAFLLREIWPRVRARRPDAELDLVGHAPRSLLPAGWDGDGVRFHGHVPDIRPWVARARVFVVPIRVGGGTRLKILDAMALGKAIVTTRVGCEGIEARGEEDLVLADTPDELAGAVLRLLEDAPLRARLGANARALAERRYDWEIVGERFIGIFRAVAAGREPPREEGSDA